MSRRKTGPAGGLPEERDELAVLAQNGLAGQVLARVAEGGGVERGVEGRLVGRRRSSRHVDGARAGQREVSGHLVADDAHALGREEADVESALAAPPHALLRRRHVDHRDHVAHLKRITARELRANGQLNGAPPVDWGPAETGSRSKHAFGAAGEGHVAHAKRTLPALPVYRAARVPVASLCSSGSRPAPAAETGRRIRSRSVPFSRTIRLARVNRR